MRVIVTSVNSIGSSRAVLSIVSDTSARPSAGRFGGAGEDDVVHLAAAQRRGALRAEHPRDGVDDVRLAGAVRARRRRRRPARTRGVVLSAKDLKPFSVSDLRNNAAPFSDGDRRGATASRDPVGTRLSGRSLRHRTRSPARRRSRSARRVHGIDSRRGGPARHQAIIRSTAASGPSNSASTAPSPRLRTKPPTPCARASSRQRPRNHTPCTRPVTTRTRIARSAWRFVRPDSASQ